MKALINFIILCLTSLTISAQTIYLEENFDDCVLPLNWETTQEQSNSKGWTVGSSDVFSTELMPYPDNNGNCFIGNSDLKWDDSEGNANAATSDKFILPFIDYSASNNLIISFDYLSGYIGGFKVFFRTENSDWKSLYNISPRGGILEWQTLNRMVFGHINAPILDVSEPIQFMFEFKDHGFKQYLGVGVDNIKIYEGPNYDALLYGLHIPPVIPVGQFPIKPGFINYGCEFIPSLEFSWQIDNGPIETAVVEEFLIGKDHSDLQLYPFGIGSIPSPDLFINFPNEGTFLLKVWMNLPANLIDENMENNYWEGEVIVKNDLPEKQFVFEKFSHNKCGPCYGVDLYTKELEKMHDNINIVGVHSASSDPMDYPPVDEIDIAYSQRTHPSTLIDRRFMKMFEHGKMNSLGELLPIITMPWYSPVDLAFTSKEIHENTISLEIQAEFIVPLEGEYRFNIWTLENGIVNYQANAPQGNNYIHDNVLRNYSGGNYGEIASLPLQLESNKKYTYSADIDIHPDWNVDSLEFLAIVQKYTPDSANREIINSKKIKMADPIILDNKKIETLDFKIYPNPSSDFIHLVLDKILTTDFNVTIYNTAGVPVLKEFYSNHQQNYIQYQINDYPSGNYLIVLESKKGKQMKHFSVIR